MLASKLNFLCSHILVIRVSPCLVLSWDRLFPLILFGHFLNGNMECETYETEYDDMHAEKMHAGNNGKSEQVTNERSRAGASWVYIL